MSSGTGKQRPLPSPCSHLSLITATRRPGDKLVAETGQPRAGPCIPTRLAPSIQSLL